MIFVLYTVMLKNQRKFKCLLYGWNWSSNFWDIGLHLKVESPRTFLHLLIKKPFHNTLIVKFIACCAVESVSCRTLSCFQHNRYRGYGRGYYLILSIKYRGMLKFHLCIHNYISISTRSRSFVRWTTLLYSIATWNTIKWPKSDCLGARCFLQTITGL